MLNVAEIAQGALVEMAAAEIQKVIDNIADPNTSPLKARKVTITLEFTPMGELQRDSVMVGIQAVASTAPYNAAVTNIFIGRDNDGNAVASEYTKGTVPGQGSLPIEMESKVIRMKGGK